MRELLADVSALKRSVGFRIPEGELVCVTGIGSVLWDRLFGDGRRARATCTRSRASPAASTPRPPPPETCSSTSAPTGSTSASSSSARLMDRLDGAATCRGRGARLPLLRRARPARLRRRDREPGGSGGRRTRSRSPTEEPEFAGGSYVIIQKYLHDMARLERAHGRGAGAGDRPHEARRHRAARRRQAGRLARRAQHDRGRERRAAADHALQHAVRARRRRRVRHLLHRLREDARR